MLLIPGSGVFSNEELIMTELLKVNLSVLVDRDSSFPFLFVL